MEEMIMVSSSMMVLVVMWVAKANMYGKVLGGNGIHGCNDLRHQTVIVN